MDAQTISTIFRSCLFKDGEDTTKHIPVHGITASVGLHPGRVAAAKRDIAALLMNLPNEFMASKGGGWSFLNMCMDKDGRQWIDGHKTMQELCFIGIAAGLADWLAPRDVWKHFTGGMPYIAVKDTLCQQALDEPVPAAPTPAPANCVPEQEEV